MYCWIYESRLETVAFGIRTSGSNFKIFSHVCNTKSSSFNEEDSFRDGYTVCKFPKLYMEDMINILNEILNVEERRENRAKAVYILGQIAFSVGNVLEHTELLYSVCLLIKVII